MIFTHPEGWDGRDDPAIGLGLSVLNGEPVHPGFGLLADAAGPEDLEHWQGFGNAVSTDPCPVCRQVLGAVIARGLGEVFTDLIRSDLRPVFPPDADSHAVIELAITTSDARATQPTPEGESA